MQVSHLGPELLRQHHRLGKAPGPVRGGIAPQVRKPGTTGVAVSGAPPRAAPRAGDAGRFVAHVLRQVEDGCANLPVDRVAALLGGVTQGHDADVETRLLQRVDLLGDESLGEPRIALEDESERARHRRSGSGPQALRRDGARPSESHPSTRLCTRSSPSSRPGTTTSEGRG